MVENVCLPGQARHARRRTHSNAGFLRIDLEHYRMFIRAESNRLYFAQHGGVAAVWEFPEILKRDIGPIVRAQGKYKPRK